MKHLPHLPKPVADLADQVIDLVLDRIDEEPPEIRARLLAAIKAGNYRATRQPTLVQVYFPSELLSFEVVLAPPRTRLDA